MERLFWICLAGAAGTAARYGIGLWAAERFSTQLAVGTLLVNLLGCFAIAVVTYGAASLAWSPTLRLALTVGFLGGFTTYSSFNSETSRLLLEGANSSAGLNVLVTVVGGLLAGWIGLQCARQLFGS